MADPKVPKMFALTKPQFRQTTDSDLGWLWTSMFLDHLKRVKSTMATRSICEAMAIPFIVLPNTKLHYLFLWSYSCHRPSLYWCPETLASIPALSKQKTKNPPETLRDHKFHRIRSSIQHQCELKNGKCGSSNAPKEWNPDMDGSRSHQRFAVWGSVMRPTKLFLNSLDG